MKAPTIAATTCSTSKWTTPAKTVRNDDLSESIVLDVDEAGRVAGIGILGASHLVNLARLLPVEYSTAG